MWLLCYYYPYPQSDFLEPPSCWVVQLLDLYFCYLKKWFHGTYTFMLGPPQFQSLRSRGIRFPGRDNESLAPIFTPPRSVSASESDASFSQQIPVEIAAQSFTAEQSKEAFDVARNSIELLNTVFSSSPQQDALQVIFILFSHLYILF